MEAIVCFSVPKRKDIYVVLTGAVWFIFLYFFWKIGDPFPILSPKHGEFDFLISLIIAVRFTTVIIMF